MAAPPPPPREPRTVAMGYALDYLRRAERTEAELRRHLARKGVADDTAESVVADLKFQRYLDDSRLAERETELAQTLRLEGRLKAQARLERRGAEDAAVESALTQYTEADERGLAEGLLRKRFSSDDDPAKAARYLVAKGFGEEAVRGALDAVFPGWDG